MVNEINILPIILSGCFVMFMMVLANIYFMFFHRKRMREKLNKIQQLENEKNLLVFKAASLAEETERERIARNLHDEINLMLALHKQVLEKHAFDFENERFDLNSYYEEIEKIEKIREAVTACATNLVPAFLLKNGLTITLEDHIRHINQAGQLKARFSSENNQTDQQFGKQVQLNIYRICLEILNNLLKHAVPRILKMYMTNNSENLVITIAHDGTKVSNEQIDNFLKNSKGLGLKSIQARRLMLKASIDYLSDDSGSLITIKIPYLGNDA